MALPDGAVTRIFTWGIAARFPDGENLTMRCKFTPVRRLPGNKEAKKLVWRATGRPYVFDSETLTSTTDLEGSIALLVTDMSNVWSDGDGGVIVLAEDERTHAWKIETEYLKDGFPFGIPAESKTVDLPTGDLSPVDLDDLLPVTNVSGSVVYIPDTWDAKAERAETAAIAAEEAVADMDANQASNLSTPGTLSKEALDAALATFGEDAEDTQFLTPGTAATLYTTPAQVSAQTAGDIAEAVADSSTVIEAAAAAAVPAVNSALSTSPRIPQPTTSEEIKFAILDEAGRRSWLEVGASGGPTQHSVDMVVVSLADYLATRKSTADATALLSIVDESGRRSWLEVGQNGGPTPHSVKMLTEAGVGIADHSVTEVKLSTDVAARLGVADVTKDALIVDRGLTVRDRAGAPRRQVPRVDTIAFWGDSLFDGWPRPPFAADRSDSVPGVFDSLYSGATYNGGQSGQSADEIAVRQGGIVLMLTVSGGSIPASGGVTVTEAGTIAWRLDRAWSCEGTLAGISGVLSRSGSTLTFTRTTSGSITAVPPGTQFISSQGEAYRECLPIIIAGRNDIGYSSPAGDVAKRVINATVAMVESLPVSHRRALLLGTITATGEGSASSGYATVKTINSTLAALYPNLFFDFRSYLVNEVIYELGITPTSDDLAKMGADTLPPSIMVSGDAIHYSPATAAKAAAKLRAVLAAKGWISS